MVILLVLSFWFHCVQGLSAIFVWCLLMDCFHYVSMFVNLDWNSVLFVIIDRILILVEVCF